jgi:hypothetical protein
MHKLLTTCLPLRAFRPPLLGPKTCMPWERLVACLLPSQQLPRPWSEAHTRARGRQAVHLQLLIRWHAMAVLLTAPHHTAHHQQQHQSSAHHPMPMSRLQQPASAQLQSRGRGRRTQRSLPHLFASCPPCPVSWLRASCHWRPAHPGLGLPSWSQVPYRGPATSSRAAILPRSVCRTSHQPVSSGRSLGSSEWQALSCQRTMMGGCSCCPTPATCRYLRSSCRSPSLTRQSDGRLPPLSR